MNENKSFDFGNAVIMIKNAIVHSRYQAAKLVNKELLGLYYAVGRYVSNNSRADFWGKGAIRQLSDSLQRELPGLRGFSESSIKRMREFYEQWAVVFSNRPLSMGDLPLVQNLEREQKQSGLVLAVSTTSFAGINLNLLSVHLNEFAMSGFSSEEFFRVGFTHHSEILAKEKSLQGRLFYISKCAAEFWTVDTLKSNLRGELFTKSGALANNFLRALPKHEQACRAIRAFKGEYLLDFINIENEIDPDERLLEHAIIANIKQFILSFGRRMKPRP